MTLTPEQKQAVASWVTAGDNLSMVQKKLNEQFKLSLTYMDVRFLVDALELSLKDAAPKVSNDLGAAPAGGQPGAGGETREEGVFGKGDGKAGAGRRSLPRLRARCRTKARRMILRRAGRARSA